MLISDTNEIKLTWNSQLRNCQKIFKGLTNIIKADLTNFDFSSVNRMENFFDWWNSLISIDLSNINAENVKIWIICLEVTGL